MKLQTAKNTITSAADEEERQSFYSECIVKLSSEDADELIEWFEKRADALWTKETAFTKWLDTFVEEKGIDTQKFLGVEGAEWGINLIPVGVVIQHIKLTSPEEQAQIKNVIVKIDFANGDVVDFFKHLAKAIAR